ncbi:MAG: ABC transporter permease, partial [Acidimicrobiia bacterium]
MSQLRAALVIAGTDLRRRLRNRSFLVQGVVGPIVLATIISLAFGGVHNDIEATIGLVDADGSPASAGFVEALVGADTGDLRFVEVDSPEEARRRVDRDLGAAVVVPEGFAASLRGERPLDVEVLSDPDAPISAEVARAVATGFADRAAAARLAALTAAEVGDRVPGDDVLAAIDLPLEVTTTGTGGDVSPAAYFGPSMGLLFLFLSMGNVARDLLAEKRVQLLDRLRAGPVRDGTLVAGRGLSVVAVGVTSLCVIWAVTTVALGAHWGPPLGVVAVILAASLAVAGIAGLVAAVARTDQSADVLASMIGFAFAMVGGAFIPLGSMPEGLQRLALLTPIGQALRALADLSAGSGEVGAVVP